MEGVIPDERLGTIDKQLDQAGMGTADTGVDTKATDASDQDTKPSEHGPFKSPEEKAAYDQKMAENILGNLVEKKLLKMPGEDKPEPETIKKDPMQDHLRAFKKEYPKVRKTAGSDEEVAAWLYEQGLNVGLAASEKLVEKKLAETVSGLYERFKVDDREAWFKKNPEFKENRTELEDLIESYRGKKSPIAILESVKKTLLKEAAQRDAEPEYTETEKQLLAKTGKRSDTFMESVDTHSGPVNGGGNYLHTRAALIDNIVAAAEKGDANAYNKLVNKWAASQ